jgi:hypothetical protein
MYATRADLVESKGLRRRLVACAAIEGATTPASWVASQVWTLPGVDWEAAWESARATGATGDIGGDPLVITDGMILAAVQARLREDDTK